MNAQRNNGEQSSYDHIGGYYRYRSTEEDKLYKAESDKEDLSWEEQIRQRQEMLTRGRLEQDSSCDQFDRDEYSNLEQRDEFSWWKSKNMKDEKQDASQNASSDEAASEPDKKKHVNFSDSVIMKACEDEKKEDASRHFPRIGNVSYKKVEWNDIQWGDTLAERSRDNTYPLSKGNKPSIIESIEDVRAFCIIFGFMPSGKRPTPRQYHAPSRLIEKTELEKKGEADYFEIFGKESTPSPVVHIVHKKSYKEVIAHKKSNEEIIRLIEENQFKQYSVICYAHFQEDVKAYGYGMTRNPVLLYKDRAEGIYVPRFSKRHGYQSLRECFAYIIKKSAESKSELPSELSLRSSRQYNFLHALIVPVEDFYTIVKLEDREAVSFCSNIMKGHHEGSFSIDFKKDGLLLDQINHSLYLNDINRGHFTV